MTHPVKHDQRRHQLADALLAVVARDGFAGASLAAIAAEAGVSIGLVQSYFRTKADLLAFGFDLIYERTVGRMRQLDPAGLPPAAAIVALLEVLLPLDAARRAETALWLAFLSAAMTEPRLRAKHVAAASEFAAVLGERIRAGQRQGLVAPIVDAEHEARLLVAVADGLTIAMQIDPIEMPPARGQRLLRAAVAHLFAAGLPAASAKETSPEWT